MQWKWDALVKQSRVLPCDKPINRPLCLFSARRKEIALRGTTEIATSLMIDLSVSRKRLHFYTHGYPLKILGRRDASLIVTQPCQVGYAMHQRHAFEPVFSQRLLCHVRVGFDDIGYMYSPHVRVVQDWHA